MCCDNLCKQIGRTILPMNLMLIAIVCHPWAWPVVVVIRGLRERLAGFMVRPTLWNGEQMSKLNLSSVQFYLS